MLVVFFHKFYYEKRQQALNEEGWDGISNQDTYNNKLQKFNDMVERGKMNMGDLFLKATEGGMDFVLQLDQATGGLVGMSMALAGFASPIADTLIGIGQMGQGFRALKDAADWAGIADKLSPLKNALTGVTDTARKAAEAAARAAANGNASGGPNTSASSSYNVNGDLKAKFEDGVLRGKNSLGMEYSMTVKGDLAYYQLGNREIDSYKRISKEEYDMIFDEQRLRKSENN